MDKKYKWPIEPKYKIVEHDYYGIRKNHYVLFKEREHSGFDITAVPGEKVNSIAKGKVIKTGFDGTISEGDDAFNQGYGNRVEILNEDGNLVIYAHLRKILVNEKEEVDENTVVGLVGSSGGSRIPHLHLEIRKGNTEKTGLENTINPLSLLEEKDLTILTRKFIEKPYLNLWNKLASDTPWEFSKEDIWYNESEEYIR